MALEIERKFLVVDDRWRNDISGRRHIRQGYLANTDRCSIRVRAGDDRADINIKGMTTSMIRIEYEYPIPITEAEDMLAGMCQGALIIKTRYQVRHAGHDWEIDVFEGDNAGLVVAEIELDTADETFSLPAWAGSEVTDDPRYLNIRLVNHPFKRWHERS